MRLLYGEKSDSGQGYVAFHSSFGLPDKSLSSLEQRSIQNIWLTITKRPKE